MSNAFNEKILDHYNTSSSTIDPLSINVNGLIGSRPAHLYNIMGARNAGWTSTSAFGDACEYLDTSQALMNTPSVLTTLYIVSTSTSDTAAGTGVRTVRIFYLDTDGEEAVVTATLNGTTPVSLGTGFSFIQWMESATVGSGGLAAGNISITSTNGAATVATTFERISVGGNRSLSGRYKVPASCTAYVLDWHVAAIGGTMDARIRADVFQDNGETSPGVFHFMDRSFLAAGASNSGSLYGYKLGSGAVVKISAIPGGTPSTNKFDCSFHILCLENEGTH